MIASAIPHEGFQRPRACEAIDHRLACELGLVERRRKRNGDPVKTTVQTCLSGALDIFGFDAARVHGKRQGRTTEWIGYGATDIGGANLRRVECEICSLCIDRRGDCLRSSLASMLPSIFSPMKVARSESCPSFTFALPAIWPSGEW